MDSKWQVVYWCFLRIDLFMFRNIFKHLYCRKISIFTNSHKKIVNLYRKILSYD